MRFTLSRPGLFLYLTRNLIRSTMSFLKLFGLITQVFLVHPVQLKEFHQNINAFYKSIIYQSSLYSISFIKVYQQKNPKVKGKSIRVDQTKA